MNTEFITRPSKAAGKAIKKNRGSLASGGLAALLVSASMQLAERWLDKNITVKENEAIEQRVNKRIDDFKTDQLNKDKVQWEAIARKKDKI